jgi:hypothetical protein
MTLIGPSIWKLSLCKYYTAPPPSSKYTSRYVNIEEEEL